MKKLIIKFVVLYIVFFSILFLEGCSSDVPSEDEVMPPPPKAVINDPNLPDK